jgi:hypothetical protein
MSYGFITDLDHLPRIHHQKKSAKRRNQNKPENGKSKLFQIDKEKTNGFQNKVLTDDESDESDSQIFRTAIPSKPKPPKNDDERNRILNSQTTSEKPSKEADPDETFCSILEQHDNGTTKKKFSNADMFSSEKSSADRKIRLAQSRSDLADTEIGEITSLETQLSYLDIQTNRKSEVIKERSRFSNLADTVIGSCTPSVINDTLGDALNPNVKPDNAEPNESPNNSVSTVVSISSNESEKKDSMEKDESFRSGSEDEVISIQDTDEGNDFSFPSAKLPEKQDDSFENCSSLCPGSASVGSAVQRKLSEFFNNVPLINTPERVITHSIIMRATRKSLIEEEGGEEDIEETRSEENRFIRNGIKSRDVDERIGSVVDESVNSIEEIFEESPGKIKPSAKFRTQVLQKSLTAESCSQLKNTSPECRSHDDTRDNEVIESEQEIVSSENTVSKSFSQNTNVNKSSGKYSNKINISASIKIKIKITDNTSTSESSEANTSSSSGHSKPGESEKHFKGNKSVGNQSKKKYSKKDNQGSAKNTPQNRKKVINQPQQDKSSTSKRHDISAGLKKTEALQSPQPGTSKAATHQKASHSKTPEMNKEKLCSKTRKKLELPDLDVEHEVFESPDKNNRDFLEFTALEADIMREIYGDSWKAEINPKHSKKPKKSLGEQNFSIFERKLSDDLESTRVSKTPDASPITSPYFNKQSGKLKETSDTGGKLRSLKNHRKAPDTPRYLDICDTDTDTDDESSGSSDESYNCNDDVDDDSQDENIEINTKKPVTRRRIREKSPEPIFNVTSDESDFETSVKEKSREQKIVDDYLAITKAPASNTTTKGKRKLFTHRHFDLDSEHCEGEPEERKKEILESQENLSLVEINPKIFKKPFNKILSSVKQIDFGITPKKNAPSTPEKPKTPRSTPKRDKNMGLELPNTVTKSTTAANVEKARSNFGYFSFLKSLDVTVNKNFCHPDALQFRENYKAKKEELAQKLFNIFNSKVFDGKLKLGEDRSMAPIKWNKKLINTAGRCVNKRKAGERFCQIELSEKVLTSGDRLRCTLIHEMCHAATWIYNAETGHGATWKAWTAKANHMFPELPKITTCHDYAIEYKYTYQCKLCKAK